MAVYVPQGRVFLWDDHWIVTGQLAANKPHRHVSASLLWGVDGEFGLQVGEHWRQTRAAVVAPDVLQALDPGQTDIWIAQLDPDTEHWQALRAYLGSRLSADLPPPLVNRRLALDTCEGNRQLLRDWLGQLDTLPAVMDERLRSVCGQVRGNPAIPLDVASLAGSVGLSASRLAHLFREQLGVTLRRFMLHQKFYRMLSDWQPGKTLSELAADAGFYDQPHMVRTARQFFDAVPSAFVASGNFTVCRCQSEDGS
ncbi:MAG: AraC family transcriptional regulator [Marinobacter sp.]|nr:AraC family transcriptional regulator [Marinobacter sp.]